MRKSKVDNWSDSKRNPVATVFTLDFSSTPKKCGVEAWIDDVIMSMSTTDPHFHVRSETENSIQACEVFCGEASAISLKTYHKCESIGQAPQLPTNLVVLLRAKLVAAYPKVLTPGSARSYANGGCILILTISLNKDEDDDLSRLIFIYWNYLLWVWELSRGVFVGGVLCCSHHVWSRTRTLRKWPFLVGISIPFDAGSSVNKMTVRWCDR